MAKKYPIDGGFNTTLVCTYFADGANTAVYVRFKSAKFFEGKMPFHFP